MHITPTTALENCNAMQFDNAGVEQD